MSIATPRWTLTQSRKGKGGSRGHSGMVNKNVCTHARAFVCVSSVECAHLNRVGMPPTTSS